MSDLEARVAKLEAEVQKLSETIMALQLEAEDEEAEIIEAQHQEFRSHVRSLRDA